MERIKIQLSNKNPSRNTENTACLNIFLCLTLQTDHDSCRPVHRLNVAHITDKYKFLMM